MRTRLANQLSEDEYQVIRSNFVWSDHVARLLTTAGVVSWFSPETVCDPACGDASILEAAYRLRPFRQAILGDLSIPQMVSLRPSFPASLHTGTAQHTLSLLPDQSIDTIVLTEILEHIEDPDSLLRAARRVGRSLVASSPIDEQAGVGNHEHVWSFTMSDYHLMLSDAGWNGVIYTTMKVFGLPYTFQTWGCR